jgi:CspA family cold shock protein
MPRGTVKWFDDQKQYGFIQPEGGGTDVFVHASVVRGGDGALLSEGQIVEYETDATPRGPKATAVQAVNAEGDHA